jgi:protein-S-isoprenylcysteine O-methyltransferase Ste14
VHELTRSVWQSHALLAAWLLVFAFFHSLLIRPGLVAWVWRVWPALARVQRLLYNAVSLLWIAATPLLFPELTGVVWRAEAALFPIFLALSLAGGALVLWVLFLLDPLSFAGLRPPGQDELKPLRTDGVFAFCRHPLYLGLMVAISFQPLHSALTLHLAVFCILYCIVGTFFEEQRLVALYQDAYRHYQARTARLIPGLF